MPMFGPHNLVRGNQMRTAGKIEGWVPSKPGGGGGAGGAVRQHID